MTYLMPAEWERHEATWLAWPHNREHWPGNFEPVPPVYAEMVRVLAESEKVFICVNDVAMEESARKVLAKAGLGAGLMENAFFYRIPTDASWARDHGPIFVRDGSGGLVVTDWIFNAWGNKYKPYDQDDAVPTRVAEIFKMPLVEPGIVMEGGSIEVNGKGTLLTTEQCLLNKNRNPHLNKKQIEDYLHKFLGVTKVLWLKEGIAGDDTDGHIDDVARFVNATTVVCSLEENPEDENYGILQKCFSDLKSMKDQDGKLLKVAALPMPDPVFYKGRRLPASYANFYIANDAVLVPTFRCGKDDRALKILGDFFPGRKIAGIDCAELVWGLGAIHCSTQQQPEA